MPPTNNKQTKKGAKTRTVKRSRPDASVETCGYPGKGGKPCGQTILTENGRCTRHADKPGAPKGNQNAVGHGAPLGNQNARTHGLFSRALGPTGRQVYDQVHGVAADSLARETADWIVAKVVEACEVREDADRLQGMLAEFLGAKLRANEIDQKAVDWFLARFAGPDIVAVGKFLGPLKGLLELQHKMETEAKKSDAGPDDSEFDGSLWEEGADGGDSP